MTLRLLFISALSLLHAAAAECCTIPVFRYALDRWEADKLRLVLPQSTAKNAALTDLLRPLRANGKANVSIETSKNAGLSQSELHFANHGEGLIWSGALDGASLGTLLDSPARKQITRSILSGDSIVWVVVGNGGAEDEAHAERITKRLKFLEQVASLPIQDPNDPDSQLGKGPPLKLKFTVQKVRRDDPAEQLLVKMLAGPKGDVDAATTSFAAAVFGRGRVLGSWKLADLDEAALEDASMFLTGRCSCRIKDNNPGWDLLLNVDWPSALEKSAAGDLTTFETSAVPSPAITQAEPTSAKPASAHPSPQSQQTPVTVSVEPSESDDAVGLDKRKSMTSLMQAAAAGSVLIIAGLLFLLKKPNS